MLAHFLIALAYKKRPLARDHRTWRDPPHINHCDVSLGRQSALSGTADGFKTELRQCVFSSNGNVLRRSMTSSSPSTAGFGAAQLSCWMGFSVHTAGRRPFWPRAYSGCGRSTLREASRKALSQRHLIVVVDRALRPRSGDWIKWEVRTFLTERDRRVFVIHVGGVLRTQSSNGNASTNTGVFGIASLAVRRSTSGMLLMRFGSTFLCAGERR